MNNINSFKPTPSQIADYCPIISFGAAIHHFGQLGTEKNKTKDDWGHGERGILALIPIIGNIILLIHDIQKFHETKKLSERNIKQISDVTTQEHVQPKAVPEPITIDKLHESAKKYDETRARKYRLVHKHEKEIKEVKLFIGELQQKMNSLLPNENQIKVYHDDEKKNEEAIDNKIEKKPINLEDDKKQRKPLSYDQLYEMAEKFDKKVTTVYEMISKHDSALKNIKDSLDEIRKEINVHLPEDNQIKDFPIQEDVEEELKFEQKLKDIALKADIEFKEKKPIDMQKLHELAKIQDETDSKEFKTVDSQDKEIMDINLLIEELQQAFNGIKEKA